MYSMYCYLHVHTCNVIIFRRDLSISVEFTNFKQFVRMLARFKRESKGHEHEMNTKEKKLDCEFNQ